MPRGRASSPWLLRYAAAASASTPASLAASLAAAGLLALACRRDEPKPDPEKAALAAKRADLEQRVKEQLEKDRAKKEGAGRRPNRGQGDPEGEVPKVTGKVVVDRPKASTATSGSGFVVDDPVVIASSGPATATPFGVVLNSSEGNLFVSPLGALPHARTKVRTPLVPLPASAGPFALGRGPSVHGEFVYWISHGSLVRRRITPRAILPLEVLAPDASDGTRVAVPVAAPGAKPAEIPESVAYIVRSEKPDGPLVAKLWTEGAPPEVLTTEGNSTHSVLAVHTESGLIVVAVQARMAMTPVHARMVRFENRKPILGDDTVVWVGGGIQPMTEMTLLAESGANLYGYMPHERSMTEFGVARLDIGMSPDMDTDTRWILYPNGIDPAPLATGFLCGNPVLLHAQPESAAPDSRQELVLRDGVGGTPVHVDSAAAYYFVSYSGLDGGGLAAWVTNDGRTSAVTLRCTKRSK